MQFQSIIAVLSFALVATSVPTGTSTSDTTVCTGDNKASYCSKTKSGNGLSGLVGALLTIVVPVEVSNILTCTTVLPILSGNQQVANACCPANGVQQTGLVNIGTVCVPVNV